ncbi:hypothetical protein JTE88_07510 [Arcanobacterium phocisimile]|uniref:Transposase n=1 Tax=Arcanobacterium phocisimile TaxID=1302235 RepID=A0ABX7IGF5_9ACTO|nr:hypothetical protein [Arcanobacterium phocisimile]QRV01917.1 hypothetical protein JTE88_07510 [Arcanobacterium phocisimile]
MPKKFDQDAKDRVVRLIVDRILSEGLTIQAACQAIAPKLGVSWQSVLLSARARRDSEFVGIMRGYSCLELWCVWGG